MKKFLILLIVFFANFVYVKAQRGEEFRMEAVEQLPEFYLGTDIYKVKLKEEILKMKIKVKEDTKFELKLTIDKQGKLIEVVAIEGSEKFKSKIIKAINNIENRWNVGKINGVPTITKVKCSIIIAPKKEVNILIESFYSEILNLYKS